MPEFFKKVSDNGKMPLLIWGVSTLVVLVLYPIVFIPLSYLSYVITPTGATATLFRTTIILGAIFTPTIAFIGSKFNALTSVLLTVAWILGLIAIINFGTGPYNEYQKAQRVDFVQKTIVPYQNSKINNIEDSPGNPWSLEPSTTITFDLTDADQKIVDIVDSYNQELISKGWIDDIRKNDYENEAYRESQPGHTFTGEEWYLKTGPKSTDYYTASIQKSSFTNNTYSVNIIFHDCIDGLCKMEELILKPTSVIVNWYRGLTK